MKTGPYSYDLHNDFGNDVKLNDNSQGKDLLNVGGPNNGTNSPTDAGSLVKSQQRVLRRLLTAPGSYIWHPDYGAGLQQYVGLPLSPDNVDLIKNKILSQLYLEDSVAKNPAPETSLQSIQGGLFVQINYTESTSKSPIVLNFTVS